MIRLPDVELPAPAAAALGGWQQEVDDLPSYPDRVDAAKAAFPLRNKKSNATFRAVKVALTQICRGARRCVYCEDSVADEVEHIAPKDLYPERVFVWDNYVYACGPCNGPKNSRYAVIAAGDALVEVTRPRPVRGQPPPPITPPVAGVAALINPRAEDPTELLVLDLETMGMTARPGLAGAAAQRAAFTVDVLGLAPGERDYLAEAWAEAFGDFADRLQAYITRRDTGAGAPELARRIRGIRDHRHPTVWFEMKRQRDRFPALQTLFKEAPEALDW